jgi:YihY family inner membrane protein
VGTRHILPRSFNAPTPPDVLADKYVAAQQPDLMQVAGSRAAYVVRNPGAFCLQVLRSFRANQALLLAGSLAYYLLLSTVPLLILMLVALSRFVDQRDLIATIGVYLERLVPGQSSTILDELYRFSSHSMTISWTLFGTLVLFSSLAFSVLERSMSVIFLHRIEVQRRHFVVSALIPYGYIALLAIGLLVMTLISGVLLTIGAERITVMGHVWSLKGVSGALLYLLGVVAEIILLTSLYVFMPVGKPTWRHALVGACAATAVWETTRHLLVWYFRTRSQVGLVYGSMTSAIVILTSFEIFAILLLLGAQVIAEYERIGSAQEALPIAPIDIQSTTPK